MLNSAEHKICPAKFFSFFFFFFFFFAEHENFSANKYENANLSANKKSS